MTTWKRSTTIGAKGLYATTDGRYYATKDVVGMWILRRSGDTHRDRPVATAETLAALKRRVP